MKAGIVLSKISDLEEVKIEEADRDEHLRRSRPRWGSPRRSSRKCILKTI